MRLDVPAFGGHIPRTGQHRVAALDNDSYLESYLTQIAQRAHNC